MVIWQIWACVCVGQMPFPPEYLAPPAERMKKERKTKAPKNKREPTGKVREEIRNMGYSEIIILTIKTYFLITSEIMCIIVPLILENSRVDQ